MQYKFDKHLLDLLQPYSGESAVPVRPYNILVAVSGGADSICLAHLLHNSSLPLNITLAHVNFHLRGAESDSDEAFVRAWADENGLECRVLDADTLSYAKSNSLSVEMAAREIRYKWFFSLKAELDIDYIAVAHHANDNAETLILNLLRGTGIAGIGGMRELDARSSILRPLLKFSREQIENYLKSKGLEFKTDSTNLESDFSRNRIRNIIVPQFEKINPSAVATLNRDMKYFSQASEILDELLQSKKAELCRKDCDIESPVFDVIKNRNVKDFSVRCLKDKLECYISINRLLENRHFDYWLFGILSEYNFNPAQIEDLSLGLEDVAVKKIISKTHIAVKERGYIKIYRIAVMHPSYDVKIDCFDDVLEIGTPLCGTLRLELLDRDQYLNGKASATVEYSSAKLIVSADNLIFPLRLRTLENGDKFRPFGMRGAKKLNDYLSDAKMDTILKGSVALLCNGAETNTPDNIICMPGVQISNTYRVTDSTRKLLVISFSN